jgi:organic hydroperoxide reductase OsmC/OhrA
VGYSKHHAKVVWEGGEDPRAHRVEVADQVFAGSSAAEFRGDPTKADPEELLVAALSSCHMLWFVAYSRQLKLKIASYEDAAEATLDADDFRFTGAVLHPRVSWEGEDPDADTVADLHRRSHESCFVSNSVNFPVEVDFG